MLSPDNAQDAPWRFVPRGTAFFCSAITVSARNASLLVLCLVPAANSHAGCSARRVDRRLNTRDKPRDGFLPVVAPIFACSEIAVLTAERCVECIRIALYLKLLASCGLMHPD